MPTDRRPPLLRLVFLQSADFRPCGGDEVELHVLVTGRKRRGAINRYLKAGWGLNRVGGA